MEANRIIKIPESLYERLQEVLADSDFSGVEEFIIRVIEDLVNAQKPDDACRSSDLSSEEVEKIRRRLNRLGYL